MITREVREWIEKVEREQYSLDDALNELYGFASYLTKEELIFIKNKIKKSIIH